ncbi:TonB-dependent receptor [Massilia antarctica]|uniref:TonB-dependent receptor n=1 Tax=Massilia antarctica TaxID=2765360 RepID=UPI0006BB6B33|nr:TonB-dependent receptor [Massilia sp. H27-R4]MCY0914797.1 TonB-dependent receptor [Massilia sp. H27-R4]CUI08165.1 TonB-dependent receptor; Outer membrane receptor for ferrienterochelin and colicins [Janthinobacterium sp. CG23_2]CUU31951.1 TonB-dependent receptor; Outer membrane receptor for ferrienterochelin and colicins [Janthinobacterium sp. CG23_2]
MISAVSPRRALSARPLALVSALSLCFISGAALAAEAQTLPAVTVTGSRFASDPALAPIGATVISADDIRRAGAADVNQAIRQVGAVYGRQSLDGSPDFSLDLRGFGTNSSQNMVVTLDGVRMSESELSNATLSSIPIETVERIEIIRGGASVLYGEGATGGVIHIVTRRPEANGRRGMLRAEAGQFGLRDLRAAMAQSWNGFALDASVGSARTDNYRDHNDFALDTFSGGAQWAYQGGRAGVRYDRARQDSDLPGALSMQQFRANPRQASTPDDVGSLDSDRLTAFVEQRVGKVDLAAELSRRERTARSTYVYTVEGKRMASKATYDSTQTQFSPRLRHLARIGGMLNELVSGVDLVKWTRLTDSDYSNADATQKSKALYVRDELKFDGAHQARVAAGARRERFEKDATDLRAFAAPYASKTTLNAWEVQGSFDAMPLVNLYAKAGRSYRVANVDENGYRSTPGVLAPQTSRDLELGMVYGDAALGATTRLFRHQLRNEIFYDPTVNGGYGANTNLDPTERKGVELDVHALIARDWRVSGNWQHVLARFTDGPNAGREMVLVPKNVVSARLAWVPGTGHSADIGVQWAGSQRFGADFANNCGARMAPAATFDARYARQIGAWEFAVAGLNLADKHYTSNAYGCNSGIYPSDGRQLKVSARYDF